MKKTVAKACAAALAGAVSVVLVLAAAACRSNSDDDDDGTDSNNSSDSVSLPADYIRGFDVSAVDYWEQDYAPNTDGADAAWYDTDGTKKDFFAILAAHGVNTARIRVWVDPENAPVTDSWWPASTDWHAGDNTTARAVSMAKRAKAAGLKVMLDFHYSDYWTDPGKQVIPHEWQSITTADAMAEKLAAYTTEVLTALKAADATPAYVQVGNEIDSGILLHTKYPVSNAASGIIGTRGSAAFNKYLAAGCKAVRDFDSSIKIILHITNRKPVEFMPALNAATSDYDIIGLSYYPWEKDHSTIASLKSNIEKLKVTYNKSVIVAEISAHYSSDGSANSDLVQSAAHLLDPATGAIYSDLTTETVSGAVQLQGTVANQTNTFRHVIEESLAAGASGIVAWGGERRADWKYAFFDWEGKAFSSLDIFAINGK